MKRIELTKSQLDWILGKADRVASERLNYQLSDIGRQLAFDQQAWVDKCMKDIMPPGIYEDAKALRNLDKVKAYIDKHKIQIVHIPDRVAVRIMLHGQVYGEWIPTFTMDGEPVKFEK